MYNPNDDPDVISGLCDDAKKEMATTPGTSQKKKRRGGRSKGVKAKRRAKIAEKYKKRDGPADV